MANMMIGNLEIQDPKKKKKVVIMPSEEKQLEELDLDLDQDKDKEGLIPLSDFEIQKLQKDNDKQSQPEANQTLFT